MVTIIRYEAATCIWCLEAAEGVQAEFKDGLKGFLCRRHFWQALKVRSEAKEKADVPLVKSAVK